MSRKRRDEPETPVVIRASGRSQLVSVGGRLTCMCGYCCAATYEPCEFEEIRNR